MQSCRTPDVVENPDEKFLPYRIFARYYDEELLLGSAGYLVHLYFVKLSTELVCQPSQRQP